MPPTAAQAEKITEYAHEIAAQDNIAAACVGLNWWNAVARRNKQIALLLTFIRVNDIRSAAAS
jgi:hypothetical protein